ncbi:fibropellin-3-like [Lethenteron reissneri]|uniref:fibropellin-3-like n=1 Tax=Lethenteron reissneri TaxID=7753 RepID=UPI002AB7575E|nr:fibropellin-3-like [Lethenteron reissneri]
MLLSRMKDRIVSGNPLTLYRLIAAWICCCCSCWLGPTSAQAPCGGLEEDVTGQVFSVGYPGQYPNNASCEWLIPAGPLDSVTLRVTLLQVEPHETCIFDRLLITIPASGVSELLCGTNASRYGEIAGQGDARLLFTSDFSLVGGGFIVQYEVTQRNPPCESAPCRFGGSCENKLTRYACSCPAGVTGIDCEINIDDCEPNPCQNGARCEDGLDSFLCACEPGFIGELCETDVDECASSPCRSGGKCVDGVDSYRCDCPPGFAGGDCETDVDECGSGPCQNGGTCTDRVASYSCECRPGYVGTHCETRVDACSSSPCRNAALCVPLEGAWRCECLAGYAGHDCGQDIDECESGPCLNGGVCTDGVDSYNCSCQAGFSGFHCQIDEVFVANLIGWIVGFLVLSLTLFLTIRCHRKHGCLRKRGYFRASGNKVWPSRPIARDRLPTPRPRRGVHEAALGVPAARRGRRKIRRPSDFSLDAPPLPGSSGSSSSSSGSSGSLQSSGSFLPVEVAVRSNIPMAMRGMVLEVTGRVTTRASDVDASADAATGATGGVAGGVAGPPYRGRPLWSSRSAWGGGGGGGGGGSVPPPTMQREKAFIW